MSLLLLLRGARCSRPDDVVAALAWENHLKRNRSVIVDLFQVRGTPPLLPCNDPRATPSPAVLLLLLVMMMLFLGGNLTPPNPVSTRSLSPRQGQYKSRLVCPKCSRVSVTFDPFM